MKHKNFTLGAFVRGLFVLVVFVRGVFVGGICPGGFCLRTVLQWCCKTRVGLQCVTCPLSNLSREFFGLATIVQPRARFYFLQGLYGILSNPLQVAARACKVYSRADK